MKLWIIIGLIIFGVICTKILNSPYNGDNRFWIFVDKLSKINIYIGWFLISLAIIVVWLN